MSVFSKPFFPFMCGYFMSLSLFTAGQTFSPPIYSNVWFLFTNFFKSIDALNTGAILSGTCIGLPVFGFPERDLDLFGRLRTFTDIFDEKYQRVSIYQKQIMVAELGVAGEPNYQKRWMLQLFRAVEDYPLLTSVVYFDSKDNFGAWERKYSVPDWRISYNLFE